MDWQSAGVGFDQRRPVANVVAIGDGWNGIGEWCDKNRQEIGQKREGEFGLS